MTRILTVGAMGSAAALNDNDYLCTGVVLIVSISSVERKRLRHDEFDSDQLT